jgi:hypothetical protein
MARRGIALWRVALTLGLLLLLAPGVTACDTPFFGPHPRIRSYPPPTATGPIDDWTALRQRPLRLPALATGAPCPINHAHQVTPEYGPGIGDGPGYAAINGDGLLSFAPPANFDSAEWGGNKVLWYFTPAVRGPVLIRGHQLDGPNELRFERGAVPPAELAIMAGGYDPGGWTGVPSFTRVRAAGCYAYQVEGANFTEVIVFEAQSA